MDENIVDQKPKNGGTLNQAAMYQIIASKFPEIIQALEDGLTDPQRSVRVGAAKVLLNKILPDLKSVEVGGSMDTDGKRSAIQLFINTGNGFVPAVVKTDASPNRSTPEQPQEVQDAHLAPESEKDDNSNLRDSEAGAPS